MAWTNAAKLRGVKWELPLKDLAKNDYRMAGAIGKGVVHVVGSRAFVDAIYIEVDGAWSAPELLGKWRATQLATTCDDDSLSLTAAVYEVRAPLKKPAYVAIEASQGAGGRGQTNIAVHTDASDAAMSLGDACRLSGS